VSSPAVITPLSSTGRGGPLSEIGLFLVTPLSSTERGGSFVRDRTFLLTPLSSTERGGLLSKIGHFSSPLCPLPRGVVFCPRSDFSRHPPVLYREGWILCPRSDISRHPPVLYREGWFFVQNRTFLRGYYSSPNFLTRLLLFFL